MSLPFARFLRPVRRSSTLRRPNAARTRTRGLRLEPLERRELLNAAPVIGPSASFQMFPINEDVLQADNTGTAIGDLMADQISDTDTVDTLGIAITALDTSHGAWQYTLDGTSWSDLTLESGKAFLLAGNGSASIRFLPESNYNGNIGTAITFYAWDGTAGTNGQSLEISAAGSSISSGTADASLLVNAVNDAPSFTSGASFVLEPVAQDAPLANNTGTYIWDLIHTKVTDPDEGDGTGIAITAVDTQHGTWQYTSDGTSWNDLTLEADKALLLDDGLSAIRFLPASGFSGTLDQAITFRAWDQSDLATSGTQATATNVGGTTPFSADIRTASLTVIAANQAPLLAEIEDTSLSYAENDPAKAVTATIAVSDADSAILDHATVQITNNYLSDQDILVFTDTSTIAGDWDSATGTLTLTGEGTPGDYQAALRSVKYQNTSDNPSVLARTVSFTVNDGTDDSNVVLRSVSVSAANDAPVLAGIETPALAYTENGAAAPVTDSITLSDLDSTNLNGATVVISSNYQNGQDVLSFTDTTSITGSWDAATGTLTLTGNDTPANYQAALRSMKYHNTSDNPSTATRTVSIKVNDGSADSNVLTRNIAVAAVNDAPVLAGIEATGLDFTEGDPATAISSTIAVSDSDSANLNGATVVISSNYQNGQDVLSFTNTTNITGAWDAATGTLTLTGSDTVQNYQAALRAVKYQNTSVTPSTLMRAVTFKVSDGTTDSAVQTRSITVNGVNDVPVLSGIETTALGYTENGAATVVTSTIAVSDANNANLAGATIQISSNYQNGQDVLSFANAGSITGAWDAATGTLTLTGSDTVLNYQAALRAVKYSNTSDNPNTATRTVTFKVNDGAADSAAVTRTIALTAANDAPVLAAVETTALSYAEGAAATAITATMTATDADSTTLAGATIQITGNYQNGQDVLSFANTNAIVGTWNATTGTLTLTGNDTPANYQAALRSVKYQNTSSTPSTLSRTVTFKVNDGSVDSAVATRSITVTAVNNAPVLAGVETTALSYNENASATAITSALTVSDAENTTLTGATIQITGNYQSGQDILSFTNTSTITGTWNATSGTLTLAGTDTLVNYQAVLRAVKYNNTSDAPSTLTRTVTFKATDGTSESTGVTRTIAVTAVNDAPVLDSTKTYTLTALSGNAASNAGTLVSTIITPSSSAGITDPDGSSVSKGIAVYGVNNTNGKWQYTTDGTTWTDFGTPSATAARLLASDTKTSIRFVPNAGYTGTVSDGISFRAWDTTSGTNGGTADVSTNGGTSAFSTATDTASINVSALNTPPTLNAIANPAALGVNASQQSVALSGIAAGGSESQTLKVTASSSNTTLIPAANLSVDYTSPNTTGTVKFTPAASQYGTSVITVTVTDAGANGVFGDADDASTSRTFTVTVGASISGSIFLDTNNDGAWKSTEKAMPNVVVTLRKQDSGSYVDVVTTTTGSDGSYSFDGLEAGTYAVIESQPANYRDGQEIVGTAGGTSQDSGFTGIVLDSAEQATGYVFAERGLVAKKVSILSFLNSRPSLDKQIAKNVGNSVVTISGTSSADTVEFTPGTDYHTVTINGKSRKIAASVDAIMLELGAGSDTVNLKGTTDADTAAVQGTVSTDSTSTRQVVLNLRGGSHSVIVKQAETVTVDGNGGDDSAVVNDSTGNDTLDVTSTSAKLTSSYTATLNSFKKIKAISTKGTDKVTKTGTLSSGYLNLEGTWTEG